jgi:hypothetical protein
MHVTAIENYRSTRGKNSEQNGPLI